MNQIPALLVGIALGITFGRWLGRRERPTPTIAQQQLAQVIEPPRRQDRPVFKSIRGGKSC